MEIEELKKEMNKAKEDVVKIFKDLEDKHKVNLEVSVDTHTSQLVGSEEITTIFDIDIKAFINGC